jgi:hypothetical protein
MLMARLLERARACWRRRIPSAEERVARALDEMLAQQEADARDKRENAWYWGETWRDVSEAVDAARRAIGSVPRRPDLDAYLRAVETALAQAHDHYREHARDEGGYGSGTLHEIRRGVEGVGRSIAEPLLSRRP